MRGGIDQYLRSQGVEIAKAGRASWVHADFSIPELRQFYTRKLKDWIDKYNDLDGFAFDMGWDIHTVPSLAYPEDGTHHGITRVMADIYKHVHKHHPGMRVVMNMTLGSPSNLWCDAVQFEGGATVEYETIESVKVYRTPMIGYYYIWEWKSVFGGNYVEEMEHRFMRNLSLGLTIGMPEPESWMSHEDLKDKLDLYALSAKLACVPMAIESGACKINGVTRREITRSVFADEDSLYVLLYNDTDEAKKIKAVIGRRYLAPYGCDGSFLPASVTQFNKRGYLEGGSDFSVWASDDAIVLEGTLPSGELVAALNKPL